MKIGALRALVQKDLLLFATDQRGVIVNIAVPLVLAAFFGYLSGGRGGKPEISRIKVLAVDLDQSELSRDVLRNLGEDKNLEVTPATLSEARLQVQKGKAPVAVVLPEHFASTATRAFFRSANRPEVLLWFDPSHATELAMVRGILTQHVIQSVSRNAFQTDAGMEANERALQDIERSSSLPDEDRRDLTELLSGILQYQKRQSARNLDSGNRPNELTGLRLPYEVREEEVAARNAAYNGYSHSFAGMGVQFVLFAAIDAAIGILTERQGGLWRRLRAAPLRRNVLLAARGISGTIIGFAILLILFAVGMAVFGIQIHGSVGGFVLVCAAFAAMASSLGLLIAAVGRTPQAARGISVFAVLVMVMLSGAWFPSFLFPPLLQKITLVIPTRWAVDGMDAMTWRGLGFGTAAVSAAILIAFAILFALLAINRFRWEAD